MIRKTRPDQIEPVYFHGFRVEKTYRKTVLDVVNEAPTFTSARLIAVRAGLTYKQCIDVLQVLYNSELIVRSGRKATAKWGKLGLTPPEKRYGLVSSHFNGFAPRKENVE